MAQRFTGAIIPFFSEATLAAEVGTRKLFFSQPARTKMLGSSGPRHYIFLKVLFLSPYGRAALTFATAPFLTGLSAGVQTFVPLSCSVPTL